MGKKDEDFILVDQSALNALGREPKEFLINRLNDPLFAEFLRLQLEAARNQADGLDPDEYETKEEFIQRFRTVRLIQRFWLEFGNQLGLTVK